jgi:hypothetical protein
MTGTLATVLLVVLAAAAVADETVTAAALCGTKIAELILRVEPS